MRQHSTGLLSPICWSSKNLLSGDSRFVDFMFVYSREWLRQVLIMR